MAMAAASFALTTGNSQLRSLLDPKPVDAGTNLIAAVHLRVARRKGVEVCAVAAAEVADADVAVGVGGDFEVLARQELVRYADVSFASDHQPGRRDFELLAVERPAHADQDVALGLRARGGHLLELLHHRGLVDDVLRLE